MSNQNDNDAKKEARSQQELQKRQGSVSRRGFLVGAGLSAAGAAILEGGLLGKDEVAAQSTDPQAVGPGEVPVTLRVNGVNRRVNIEPRTTLADTLLFELNLTGTKIVCNRGACSACTVWLDDTPVCSCMTMALDVGKRNVTTIEGLAQGDRLHPVQAAFIEYDAAMCGYCTPGMVMSCAALLDRNPNPTLEDVQTATSGNLCRCGTYPKVFEATLAAAKTNGSSNSSPGGEK